MKNFLPLLLALVLPSSLAAADPAPEKPIVPDRVAKALSPTWDGPQIVRADRAGNVYFFRADTLEVYPLTQGGKLGEPQRLELVGDPPQIVRDVALSPGGDVWLLSADLGLRYFVDGKEKVMPELEWRPSGIGFQRDAPVVALLPLAVPGGLVYQERKGQVPRVLAFDGNRWNAVAEYSDLSATGWGNQKPDLNGAFTNYATLIASDPEGRLWIARRYAYVLEQLTPSGKQRLRFVVAGGKVIESKAGPGPRTGPAGFNAFRSQPAIFDLTEGRDHRMYFLAADGQGGGLVLDRYNAVSDQLERVQLAIDQPVRLTMASGKDGLYLASLHGQGGRWLISWDTLELATWKPVPNAEISPAPLPELPATKPAP